jgi:hypothetical protein
MEIFLHSTSGIELVEVDDDAKVNDIVERTVGKGGQAWLQDVEAPLPGGRKVSQVVPSLGHVHVSDCKRVQVTVRYNGSKTRAFSPAATIQSVFEWAANQLTETERPKHELGVCNGDKIAERTAHVGTLAGDACELCLDLAPADRWQG